MNEDICNIFIYRSSLRVQWRTHRERQLKWSFTSIASCFITCVIETNQCSHGSQDVHETVTIIRHLPLWCWKTRKRYLLDHKKPTPQSNTFFLYVHSALYKSQHSQPRNHPTYNNLPQHNVSHSQLSSIMWLGGFKRHHLNALCPRVQRNKRQQKPRYLPNPYPNYGGSSNTCV